MNKEILGSAKTPLLAMKGPATTGPAIVTCSETTFPLGKLIADETEKWGQGGEVCGHQSGLTRVVPTVRSRAHHRLGGDIAAGTRAIFNDELLPQPLR